MAKEVIEEIYVRDLANQKRHRVTAKMQEIFPTEELGKMSLNQRARARITAWFNTPLGRYCPNTGRHLTSGEVYKIAFYNDATRDITIEPHMPRGPVMRWLTGSK